MNNSNMAPELKTRSGLLNLRTTGRVLVKAGLLFLMVNIFFAVSHPLPAIGKLSLYNRVFPGRQRLPYGDNPSLAYNVTLTNLEAMFASQALSAGTKSAEEYRVIIIGDSATWGYLQAPDETISSQLNQMGLTLSDGRKVKVYNLGYPAMSLVKDLLILSKAVSYSPDLIIWPVTLESFPYDKQLFTPLIQNNPDPVKKLIEDRELSLNPFDPAFTQKKWYDKTLIGSRRELADLLRFQFYGAMWAATGIDQDLPTDYPSVSVDLSADTDYHNLHPPHLDEGDLALEIIQAGIDLARDIPVILVNEPIFISQGENSDIRYNFYYPRWAYDDFRQIIANVAQKNNWFYQDAWNLVPPDEFTNTAIHLSPEGAKLFANEIAKYILQVASRAH